MQSKQKNQRKLLIVNLPFQKIIVLYFCCMSLITSFIFYFSFLFFINHLLEISKDFNLEREKIFIDYINQQATCIHFIFMLLFLIIVGFFISVGLILSHKIAGPIYKFSLQLKEMTEKKSYRTIKFRKGDFFPELAENFNNFLGSLPVKIEEDEKQQIDKLPE